MQGPEWPFEYWEGTISHNVKVKVDKFVRRSLGTSVEMVNFEGRIENAAISVEEGEGGGGGKANKKTLPKAQWTRGLSSGYQRNFFRWFHKFSIKSWSYVIFIISTKQQLQPNISVSTKLKLSIAQLHNHVPTRKTVTTSPGSWHHSRPSSLLNVTELVSRWVSELVTSIANDRTRVR